jgi:hypothetical protein
MLGFISPHEDEGSVSFRNVCKLPAAYIPEGSNVHKPVMFVFMEQAFRLTAMVAVVRWEGLKSDDSEVLPFLLLLLYDTVQQSPS